MMRSALALILLLSCALAGLAAPTAADKQYTTGKQYFDKRAYNSAITELNKFITAYPKDARVFEARFMLGRAYQHREDYDRALALYLRVTNEASAPKYAPLRAEVHYQTAECYWMLKQFEKAIKYYRYSLVLSGEQPDLSARAHYWLAESLYQLERFPEAKAEYAAVPEIAPKHDLAPWAVYSSGMIELRESHFAEAIAALEQVIAGHPDSPVVGEATLMLGFAYSRRAQTEENAGTKEADLRKAIELFTRVSGNEQSTRTARQSATLALAETYFLLKDYERANDTFLEALKMIDDPASSLAMETQLRRGHTLYDAGRFRDAIAVYTIVASGRNSDAATQALLWQGNSLYQAATKEKDQKAYIDAIAAFTRYRTKAGEKAPDMPHAALLTAFCLEDLAAAGDPEAGTRALLAFQEICTKWPMSREAGHAQDGIARMTASMPIQQLRAVVEKLPEGAGWSVDLSLARKEFREGKYEQALIDARKVLDTQPTSEVMAQAAYIIGACLQQTDRAADAIKYYEQARDAAPTGELAPFILRGLMLANMDRHEYALARDAALALSKLPLAEEEMSQALLYLGNAYTANGQFTEAMDTYQRITTEYAEVEATLPLAYMGLAGTAEAKKDAEEAIARYREVIRKFPDHDVAGEAFYRIGIKQTELKQYGEAVKAFRNVPAAHRLADRAAYALAWVYHDQGKVDEANAQFVNVADQFPDSTLAADGLARVGEYWMEKQQYPDAMKYFNRAFQVVKPGSLAESVAYKLGVSAFYAKNYPVAVIGFDKVVTGYPTSKFVEESLFMKARSLDLQDQATLARDAYLQFLEKYPKRDLSLDAALGAGRASLAIKQYAQARGDLRKAEQLYEDLKKVPGLLTEAKAERAKAVMAEVQYYLAQSYFEENNFSEAFKGYAAVPDGIEPWASRALLQMAKCSGQLGNMQDAKDVLQTLVALYPKSDAALQAPMVAKDLGVEIKIPAP
jgi:TolA-binding protein